MDTTIQQLRPDIQIDTRHSRAICDEIGWRLRKALVADYATLPHDLVVLLHRLIDIDMATDAPSLAPALDDMRALSENTRETANA